MLTLRDVRFGYSKRASFLGPINVSISQGECWAIVGPNGAGKSTLVRLMAGLLKPSAGQIELDGQPIFTYFHRERAKRISYVPQSAPGDLDMSTRDAVLLGRFPHRYLGMFESSEDHAIALHSMRATGVDQFADRSLITLSGGERQRVHVAAAMAQGAELMLLDEPTASLDLQHQLAIFQILRRLAREEKKAVVAVTHDVNLAAMFCDKVLLIHEGKIAAAGSPVQVLTPERLEPVYGVRMTLAAAPGAQWIVPQTLAEGA